MAKDPVVTKVKARHPRGDGSATGNESPPDQQSRPTLDRKAYDRELARLQIELSKLQEWVRLQGWKLAVIFEGRDAAGKGGVIKRITQPLNPRYRAGRGARARPPSARGRSGTSSATSRTCRPPGRSSCSTAAGTTGPASSASWASAPTTSTRSSCAPARSSSGC